MEKNYWSAKDSPLAEAELARRVELKWELGDRPYIGMLKTGIFAAVFSVIMILLIGWLAYGLFQDTPVEDFVKKQVGIVSEGPSTK